MKKIDVINANVDSPKITEMALAVMTWHSLAGIRGEEAKVYGHRANRQDSSESRNCKDAPPTTKPPPQSCRQILRFYREWSLKIHLKLQVIWSKIGRWSQIILNRTLLITGADKNQAFPSASAKEMQQAGKAWSQRKGQEMRSQRKEEGVRTKEHLCIRHQENGDSSARRHRTQTRQQTEFTGKPVLPRASERSAHVAEILPSASWDLCSGSQITRNIWAYFLRH